MKSTLVFGYGSATLLILSSVAHAFGGWPLLAEALQQSGADPSLVGAIGAGWMFGSVAMLAFGLILLVSTRRVRAGIAGHLTDVWIIASAYLAFGLGAFVIRDFNTHFLFFVGTGALIATYGLLARRSLRG